ncbi:Leucine-rich repeat domain, L domain-like [Phytophthora cactorum]|nr:Leucine-rich repeat domain, L domain-like [Phytophthora cactorum]
MSKRVADTQLPPNDSTAGSQSPTRFLGRLSWDKGMLDNSVSASSRTCKHSARPPAVPSTLAPLASPVKPPVLTSQPSSLKKTEIPVSKPSPTGLKKQLNAGNGSYPMTIEESFDQVEKMLEEHRRQRKEQKPRRVEALSIINEASPLQRHTFVFAPLDDPRILSEIAAQDAVDAREGLKKGESEMDMEVGGSNTKLKYFGPDARTSYYLMYRELHNKPHLFIDRDTHEQHHRGSIRSNLSVAGRRRSTGMRRSLPTLEQAQISVGSGDMNLVSSVPRSPRTLFLGASLAGGQTAPTLLLRKEHNQRTFDLSHQGLGDNFIVRFAACLPELPLVECINVCNNRLTDAGISCLLRALENKPHLTSLDISSNPIGVDAATILRGYIRSNLCTLRVLALNEVSLSDHECARLVKALEHNKSIDRFYSVGITLDYRCLLKTDAKLQRYLTSRAVGLASGLAVNSSLSMLTLDGNPLGVQGGKALMHASCAPRPTSTVCQLSLLDCSLNVSAPKMSAATGDEQLHVFNPVDPAGSYVLDLSDAYEHMVAHELLRLAVSHPARFHFTKLEYNASTQRGQVTKLEMVKRRIKPSSAPEDTIDTTSSGKSLNPVALMFQRLDEDGSGSVEFSELVNALRSCGLDVSDEQLVELLEKYDYDKSGSLRKREFADLFARVGFDFVDSDNSGSLDTDELRRVFQLLGVTERAEVNDAIARMIAKYDLDGSGKLGFRVPEFMTSEVFTVQDVQKIKENEEAKLMRLEPCEVGSGASWQIPNSGQLTADFAHSGGVNSDTGDNTGEVYRPSDSVLMPDNMLSRFLINASSISRNITEQTEFLHTVSQNRESLAKLLPRIIDHREATSLVTRIVDIHNQWLECLALRRWLGPQLYSVLVGSLTNVYSFDLTREDHRIALHRLALVAQEEKQFSRWRSGRGDTSQSGNWENFRWATLDGEPVLLSSSYILNKLLGPVQERSVLPPSRLFLYYVSTTRPPRGTKPLSQRRFEQLVAVLAQPPDDSEISALCEDRRDQEQESTVSNDKKRTQALLHWELLRRFVRSHRATEKRNRNKRRSIAGETMDRLTNTLEGLQQKLQLLEILVADRWLTCVQAQELLSAFPNAVRARARAACLVFSRIIDLENFIQCETPWHGGLGILVIDQQVSFHPGGSLAIDSANADAARIISNHTSELSQVVLTLDSHQRYHIAHGIFWENEAGESPSPFTTIYAQNITDGVWKPRDSSLHDWHTLSHWRPVASSRSLSGRNTVLSVSPGHNIVPDVLESALEWTKESLKPIQYVMKGSNPFTEHYSALKAEYELPYDPSTSLNTALIKSLQRAGKLVIVGEALSHCVNFTVRDLVDNWPVDRLSDLVILTDCSSAVAGFEAEAEQFLKDMAAKGLTLTTSTEFNA